MGAYKLICLACKKEIEDNYTLNCPCGKGLLRAVYEQRQLTLRDLPGMWRFFDWLPSAGFIDTPGRTVTYKSKAFAKELGIRELYIAYNGYWPEIGARMDTCSFKELEAPPTIQRAKEHGGKAMVLASVGNTARAFAYLSTITGFPLIIVVPKKNAGNLWIPGMEPGKSVHLITMEEGNDYTDAINLSNRIAALPGMLSEGGAKNVARRDGMATVMLDSAVFMKTLPDEYFQAIGSGTGGIAVYEAALRLMCDGRFGSTMPRLHLAQNLPFAPMMYAWNEGRRELIPERDMPDAKKAIEEMYTDILSNRTPPYSIIGGVFDTMKATNGHMYGVTNKEAIDAKKIFESCEGIDILPPAAVAVSSLIQACDKNVIGKDKKVLLNITGGGFERLQKEVSISMVKPCMSVNGPDADLNKILKAIK